MKKLFLIIPLLVGCKSLKKIDQEFTQVPAPKTFLKQSSDVIEPLDPDSIVPFSFDTNKNYNIQCSFDLVNWHQATVNIEYVNVDLGNYYDIRVYKTNQQMFFRLIPN